MTLLGQRPEDIAGRLVGEDLVDGVAVEVSMCQRTAVVEDEDDIFAIVHERFGPVDGRIAVVVHFLADQAAVDVVGVQHLFGLRVVLVAERHGDEAIAVVPGVFDVVAGTVGPPGARRGIIRKRAVTRSSGTGCLTYGSFGKKCPIVLI
jgi:hypothetical protein